MIEPNFTRTQIKSNAVFAAGSVAEYDGMRARVGNAVATLLEHGMNPEEVARAVLWALQARNPKNRYPTGRSAMALWRSRRWLPAQLFDQRLCRQIRLDL